MVYFIICGIISYPLGLVHSQMDGGGQTSRHTDRRTLRFIDWIGLRGHWSHQLCSAADFHFHLHGVFLTAHLFLAPSNTFSELAWSQFCQIESTLSGSCCLMWWKNEKKKISDWWISSFSLCTCQHIQHVTTLHRCQVLAEIIIIYQTRLSRPPNFPDLQTLNTSWLSHPPNCPDFPTLCTSKLYIFPNCPDPPNIQNFQISEHLISSNFQYLQTSKTSTALSPQTSHFSSHPNTQLFLAVHTSQLSNSPHLPTFWTSQLSTPPNCLDLPTLKTFQLSGRPNSPNSHYSPHLPQDTKQRDIRNSPVLMDTEISPTFPMIAVFSWLQDSLRFLIEISFTARLRRGEEERKGGVIHCVSSNSWKCDRLHQ